MHPTCRWSGPSGRRAPRTRLGHGHGLPCRGFGVRTGSLGAPPSLHPRSCRGRRRCGAPEGTRAATRAEIHETLAGCVCRGCPSSEGLADDRERTDRGDLRSTPEYRKLRVQTGSTVEGRPGRRRKEVPIRSRRRGLGGNGTRSRPRGSRARTGGDNDAFCAVRTRAQRATVLIPTGAGPTLGCGRRLPAARVDPILGSRKPFEGTGHRGIRHNVWQFGHARSRFVSGPSGPTGRGRICEFFATSMLMSGVPSLDTARFRIGGTHVR